MKWLYKLITRFRNFKRIQELEEYIAIAGDRRDWDACEQAEKELNQLLGINEPEEML